MKKIAFIVITAILILQLAGCVKQPSGPERPYFTYNQPIVNPPDEFVILFSNSQMIERMAEVTFAEPGVWKIEKLGETRYFLSLSFETSSILIPTADTIGLDSNKKYKVFVRNTYTGDANYIFVLFKKLDIPYEGFLPKL